MPTMPTNKYQPYDTKKAKNWLRNKEDVKFYSGGTWRKFSKDYKRNNPVCEVDGCTNPSYYTDHIKPISEGGDKYEYDNIQALCKSCNGRKTQKQGVKLK